VATVGIVRNNAVEFVTYNDQYSLVPIYIIRFLEFFNGLMEKDWTANRRFHLLCKETLIDTRL